MTRRSACTVIATLGCLLAVATSAHAEGAWVLWSQEVATEPGLAAEDKKAWRPIATFETKSSCFSDASTKAEELANMLRLSDGTVKGRKIEVQRLGLGQDHLAVKSTFSGDLFDGARLWTFYKCLPDTVDPRGPKR
jgi:predicted TPR repeat methyltransferase